MKKRKQPSERACGECGRQFERVFFDDSSGWVTGCPVHVVAMLDAFKALRDAAIRMHETQKNNTPATESAVNP